MSEKLDAVVAGLAVVDIIGRPIDLHRAPRRGGLQEVDSITLTTGGNVSNVGIDLAKLGFRVGAITRVGNDGLGRFVTQRYSAHGIDTTGIAIDATKQTSSTIVCVGKDGERTFFHTRGCMRNFRASEVLNNLALLQRAAILSFGYLGLLPETERDFGKLFRTVKEQTSVRILLDTGGAPRKGLQRLKSFLPYVDYFIPSYEEAVGLTGVRAIERIVQTFRKAGARGVVGVKAGARGCFLDDGDRALLLNPPRVRRVVDATGAGDAFVAGFLAGILKGYPPFEAARIGNAVAADCITAVGASTAIKPIGNYV